MNGQNADAQNGGNVNENAQNQHASMLRVVERLKTCVQNLDPAIAKQQRMLDRYVNTCQKTASLAQFYLEILGEREKRKSYQ